MEQPKRILLIDDDHDHLFLCNVILRNKGYDVRLLPGCEKMTELAEVVDNFRPDLIFLDHDMRGICGHDLTRFLKMQPGYSKIPVIYFTGRDDIVKLAKAAGADGYFRKPFEVKGLEDVTARYLTRA